MAFTPTIVQRSLFVIGGLGAAVLGVWFAITDNPLWVILTGCGVGMVFEGARAQVLVGSPVDEGRVESRRAFRRSIVPVSEIAAVRIPRWGPIVLRLQPESRGRSGIWPGQIVTGVYANRLDPNSIAVRLAEKIGVPVESDWRR